MPTSFVLCCIIVGGYIFLRCCKLTYIRSRLLAGHRFYIELTIAGALLFLVSRVLVVTLFADLIKWDFIKDFYIRFTSGVAYVGTGILTCILSIILSIIVNFVYGAIKIQYCTYSFSEFRNRITDSEEKNPCVVTAFFRWLWESGDQAGCYAGIMNNGSPLQVIIYHAATSLISTSGKPYAVGVTIRDSRKIYTALVNESLKPWRSYGATGPFLELLPVASGYRDAEGRPIYNHRYPNPLSGELVVFPVERVESIRLFGQEDIEKEEDGQAGVH